MAAPKDETIPEDRIMLADTRPALPYGMPFNWLIVTAFGPPILALVTFNFWLIVLWLPMWIIGRLMVAHDHNRPRVLRLWIMSGAAFADRSKTGSDSPSVFPPTDKWLGIFHG